MIRGLASTDRPQVGHFTDSRRRCWTSWPARSIRGWPRWAPPARTTSCAPRSGRWCWTCRRPRRWTDASRGCASCTPPTGPSTRPTTSGTPSPDSPPMRGADPAIVLVPGRRHVLLRREQADRPGGRRVLRQRHQRDARRRGGLTVRPDRRGGEVPDRVLGPGGGEARRGCRSRSRWPAGSRWSPARGSGIGRAIAHRLAAEGACVVVADRDADAAAATVAAELGGRRRGGRRSTVDVTDEAQIAAALVAGGGARLRRGRPGRQQRRPVHLQAAAGDHRRATGTCSTT